VGERDGWHISSHVLLKPEELDFVPPELAKALVTTQYDG